MAKYLNCNNITSEHDGYLIVCSQFLAIGGESQEPRCRVNQTANLQTSAAAAVRETAALCCTYHVTATTLDTDEENSNTEKVITY